MIVSKECQKNIRVFTYMYCTVLSVFNPTMRPNVQCWRYLTTLRYVYVICHFWTPICNVLGYRRHRSICYTCLFTTPLLTTISVYSVLWPSDVVSRSGPLISSIICSVISLQCLYLCLFCLLCSLYFLSSFPFCPLIFLCLYVWVWVLCYDRRSVGQSVLEWSTHLGLTTRFLLLPDSCGFVDLGRSLWREDGSVVCNCSWPLPAQSFSGPSPFGLATIFYCLRFETSHFVASYDSQGHGLISCPSSTMFAPGIEDIFSHGCIFRCFGFATIWLLRKLLTVKNI
jgi:hypothetical protein